MLALTTNHAPLLRVWLNAFVGLFAQEDDMASIDRIRAKWDAQAAPQLRAELERMRAELETAQARAEKAENDAAYWMDVADGWRDDLLAEIERSGAEPGLTKSGHLVAV